MKLTYPIITGDDRGHHRQALTVSNCCRKRAILEVTFSIQYFCINW